MGNVIQLHKDVEKVEKKLSNKSVRENIHLQYPTHERINKIKDSLVKINKLMTELNKFQERERHEI